VTRFAVFVVLVAAACLIAAAPRASVSKTGSAKAGSSKTAPVDAAPFDGLKEIEAFSDASARGDQAGMSALLADQMLFSAGDGAVQRDPKLDRADAVTLLIRKRTDTFRAALARGDRAGVEPLLDDELIYVNEDGAVSGRRDLQVGPAPGAPKPTASSVKLTDWIARHVGGVVVSTYVVDTLDHYGQQSVEERSLAMDVWLKQASDWKLIESQIIPLNQDPVVANAQPGALDDYVGTYAAAPNFSVAVSHDGQALALSTNGGKPVQVAPEATDIFFVPGLESGVRRSRIVFQRDAAGAITGYVSSRGLALKRFTAAPAASDAGAALNVTSSVAPASDLLVRRLGALAVTSFIHDRVTRYPGQALHTQYRSTEAWVRQPNGWKMLTLQSLELPIEPPAAPLSSDLLNDYVGDYAAAPGVSAKIVLSGGHLSLALIGENASVLASMAHDAFFIPGQPRDSLLFQRDASGRVLGYFLRSEGRDLAFRRL
jgi:hypothetical protein